MNLLPRICVHNFIINISTKKYLINTFRVLLTYYTFKSITKQTFCTETVDFIILLQNSSVIFRRKFPQNSISLCYIQLIHCHFKIYQQKKTVTIGIKVQKEIKLNWVTWIFKIVEVKWNYLRLNVFRCKKYLYDENKKIKKHIIFVRMEEYKQKKH